MQSCITVGPITGLIPTRPFQQGTKDSDRPCYGIRSGEGYKKGKRHFYKTEGLCGCLICLLWMQQILGKSAVQLQNFAQAEEFLSSTWLLNLPI
jgi:hypothetical protein